MSQHMEVIIVTNAKVLELEREFFPKRAEARERFVELGWKVEDIGGTMFFEAPGHLIGGNVQRWRIELYSFQGLGIPRRFEGNFNIDEGLEMLDILIDIYGIQVPCQK